MRKGAGKGWGGLGGKEKPKPGRKSGRGAYESWF